MKNKITVGTIVLLSVLVLVECKRDFLERTPPGVASVDGFYTSEDAFVAGVNGIYHSFQGDWWGGAFIHLQPHLEGATDNGKICCTWEYGIVDIATGTMNSNSGGFVNWKWNFGYQAITRINQMLSVLGENKIPEITAEKAKKYEGELKFLRAFVYQQLIFYYGDVPLITAPITPAEAKALTRTGKDEVFAKIVEDLNFAVANLENTPNNGQFGRPTRQAALTLLGKAYLYEKKWMESAQTLSQVIAMEGTDVILDPDYESLFRGKNEQSKEIIFSIQYVGESQGGTGTGQGNFIQTHYAPTSPDGLGGGWQSNLHTYRMRDAYYMIDGKPITASPMYNPDSPFINRDPRLGWTFYIPGTRKLANGDSVPYATWRGFPVVNSMLEHQGVALTQIPGAAGMGTKKWCDEADKAPSNTGNTSADLILMRYADVLLMYAEAQNEASGPDASVYSAVNKVRARAKMPDFNPGLSQEQMREEIRHERNVEFAMEGMRYNDLIRWRIAETVIPSVQNIQNRTFNPGKNYLWPIPQSVIDATPGIKQNPGY